MDSPVAQIAATVNLLEGLVAASRKLAHVFTYNYKDIPASLLNTWESLIPEYISGHCKVTPITTGDAVKDLINGIPEMEKKGPMWLGSELILKPRDFCRDSYRLFMLKSPKSRSILFLGPSGYRGKRWSIHEHLEVGKSTPSVQHKRIAQDLLVKYETAHHKLST